MPARWNEDDRAIVKFRIATLLDRAISLLILMTSTFFLIARLGECSLFRNSLVLKHRHALKSRVIIGTIPVRVGFASVSDAFSREAKTANTRKRE